MATPEILDFARLLQPVSDEQPAGVELKADDAKRSIYQAVKDARESARTAEKKLYQAAWLDQDGAASAERPDWRKVYDLATDAIASQSKDLWIAAWLIEALARTHGFAGLRDGFRLTRELVAQYWENIHPRPDEDGIVTTVAQLTGLNGDESEGALLAPIDRIPITAPGSNRALSSTDHKDAVKLDQTIDADKRAERLANGAISLEMFDKAVRETSPEFFQGLIEDIEQSIDEFGLLNEALETACGNSPSGYTAAPPTSAIRNALAEVRDRVRNAAAPVLGTPAGEGGAAGEAGSGTAAGGLSMGGKAASREEAFRQLLHVADFFRRTEPHSPVSYALEQAVRWGKMTLPELLAELVSDNSVRGELYRRMGIVEPESENS